MPAASGTAQTRFGIAGWGTRRAGSFAGKAAPSPSINLRIKFGDSVLLATGALAPPSGASGIPFEIQGFFVVRALGSPATLSVSGRYDNGQSSGLLALTDEVSTPVNSTIDNDLHATIQFGVASPSNSATVQNIIIEKYASV